MNCSYHHPNPISTICVAPHNCQCQRKLCHKCLYEHGVDVKYAIPVDLIQEMVMKKLQEYNLDTSEIREQKNNFKLILSQTESKMKRILDEFTQSINEIYDLIEKKNKSYSNLINRNINIAESSYSELEQIASVLLGNNINDWLDEKNSFLDCLSYGQNQWEQQVQQFLEKLEKEIMSSIQPIQQMLEIYEKKEDNIDRSFLNYILYMLKEDNKTDIIQYLYKRQKSKLRFISNILKDLSELDFSKEYYSKEECEQSRKQLIREISYDEHIIEFLKFLVQLTAIDERFIQCGSNSLNLLVEMKVDLREQSFEKIRIQETSLVGGNFFRCNFNESKLYDVDISGINLNQAQLFNCKWKDIKIHELNKLDGHSSCIRSVNFSPDVLISLSVYGMLRQDYKKPYWMVILEHVYSICYSPDGTTLASGSDDNTIRIWDFKSQQRSQILSVCFSPDGTTLAFSSDDNSIYLWDLINVQYKGKLNGHNNSVIQVCFSSDGNTLASCSYDLLICLWDSKSQLQNGYLYGHNDWVNTVCFSPDGNTLASGSYDQSLRLWDIKTGQQTAKFNGHSDTVRSVCFSPDGKTIASGSDDESIRLWNVKTKQQIAKLDAHTSGISSVYFSPNGTTLASCSFDQSIRIWDVMTQQQKASIDDCACEILSVCFSPDGTTLAYGGKDKSICLMDIMTGQQKSKIRWSLWIGKFNLALASGSKDSTVILWDFKAEQQILTLDNSDKVISAQTGIYFSYYLATVLLVSQSPNLEALGAQIMNGEFVNQSGEDLKQLFKERGGIFLENEFALQNNTKDYYYYK
ncbi:unnamed protein product (macronuclear) [Paramecium tetraurelia]|uniref:Uncharacterized protein n=1 Tax=Paramecium tetraurelia TaxID=5888 RepID=A0EDI8_PARTE|nr:uncharacterized protein GSPATT00025698001 [Paramecium tetraurelia]CAK93355.1 unnamed protein product [Paramecium tetraurelia]|eukprot:XP_001460752.1 hypothetical protein (macronuclear) [Paramecium tetraurelia strain d4-2]